jgi:hypothetical protein
VCSSDLLGRYRAGDFAPCQSRRARATIIDTGVRRQPPRSGSSTDPATEIIVVVESTVFRPDHIGGSETTGHTPRRRSIRHPTAQGRARRRRMAGRNRGAIGRCGTRRPAMFARIGVMKALNRRVERVFNPSEKDWRRVPIVSTARSTVPLRLGFGERRGRAGRRAGLRRPDLITGIFRGRSCDILNASVCPTAATER